MSAFDDAFAVVIGIEGGYTNDRNDAGNWTGGVVGKGTLKGTNWGISAASYPTLNIKGLTQADAKAIYQRDFWAPLGCDAMPYAVALVLFDGAVNSGVWQAAKWLQGAVGAEQDGWIGPLTMAALAKNDPVAVASEMLAHRTVYLAGLSTWRTYGLGWSRRICRLPWQATSN